LAVRKSARSATSDRTVALTALRALIASLGSSARAIESRTGLTNAQLFLLRQIGSHDDASINELAALARTRQNTVSSLVGRLVRHGMLRKSRSASDGRRAAISLTAKGERLLAKAPESPTEVLIAGIDALGGADVKSLATGLMALAAALGVDTRAAPLLFENDRGR
jgi:DNA-binding MarR family transcriptional regulator